MSNMEIFKEFLRKTGIGLKEFLKASIISASLSFIILLIALKLGNVPYYGLIAIIIAIVDIMPVLGSGIVLIPWSIISYSTGNIQLALILVLAFVITFLIDQLLVPLLLGRSIGLKPVYTIIITLASMLLLSPALGAIVGSILSIILAVIIDMKKSQKL